MSHAAALLEAVLEHNRSALASLFQTGVFFFALAYCGSNLVEIGRLFKARTQPEPQPKHKGCLITRLMCLIRCKWVCRSLLAVGCCERFSMGCS